MLVALLITLAATDQPPIIVEKPKKICRQEEQSLGTHIRGGRKCKTAEEWERTNRTEGSNLCRHR